jgi:Protein of unknown function (DUF1592)/Protein of unknown function (DUF1588)/Protein of unknown function (DUF1585)/Protein of unknown function (DUF1587)/Protein of unknown function (DUF1595)
MAIVVAGSLTVSGSQRPGSPAAPAAGNRAFLDQYCVSCHNERIKTSGLALDRMDVGDVAAHADVWEKVVRKLRTGMMPPSGAPRPERTVIDAFATTLETRLDGLAASAPNPGAPALHRLNRTEYATSIRDLLALEVDVAALLPADDVSEGFDNIADVLGVSPALMQGYLSAATKISRLALGDESASASRVTYRVPAGLSQSDHLDGMPIGTRGGLLFHHTFPLDAEYEFRITGGGGAGGPGIGRGGAPVPSDDIEMTVNAERVKLLRGSDPRQFRLAVKAGPQTIGVALIPRRNAPGVDDVYGVFAGSPGVQSVVITGPFNPAGPGDTPSRQRVLVCRPATPDEESACAATILMATARRAYRRPIASTDPDLKVLLQFYREGRQGGTFETGVQRALARMLVDPQFLFRFEREPANVPAGSVYRISDLELASRLSFFLWSTIPDDELLEAASRGRLHDPTVLETQVRRMLADPRSRSLVTNFAGQWLSLRALKDAQPDTRSFNENLRQAFERETELLFETIMREDRSLIDLLDADFTFVDERLAEHYGIAGIRGSRFRRVTLTDENRRGLLGHGSILLVTSVANRTSPVVRGKWILENILGTPAPVPPPNVEGLDATTAQNKNASLRERLEQHRAKPVCASCHRIMDPLGFSLENFDFVGRWRDTDGPSPVDASGQLVDGTKLDGPASLRRALLARSDAFVTTATEKLLTYALGRAVRHSDMPAIRQIVRTTARDDYRFSSLVLGIVGSVPFQMRTKGKAS